MGRKACLQFPSITVLFNYGFVEILVAACPKYCIEVFVV